MPPAARPSVSEKIRLTTSPSPIAASTMAHRPVLEVQHDLFPESDDVPDSDHDPASRHEVEDALVAALGVHAAQVVDAIARQATWRRAERDQLGAESRQHDLVRGQRAGDEFGDLSGALRSVVAAVREDDAPDIGLGAVEPEPVPDEEGR